MLKVFRENLKYLSWILWAVIAVFVLFVFVDFGSVVPGLSNPKSSAVTVGGQEVTYGEYQRAYRNLEEQFRQIYGEQFTPEVSRQLGLDRQAIENLINQKVLIAEARRLGLSASDGELRELILTIPWLKDEQGRFIGGDGYERVVRELKFPSVEDFEATLRDEIVVEKLTQILSENVYLSDAEVEQSYRDQVEKASIRFVLLPSAGPEAPAGLEVEATREELETYLGAHAERFRLPERRRIAYLLTDLGLIRGQVEVADAEVEAYYGEHPDEFTQEEQVRARHILLRVDDQRSKDEALVQIEALRRRIEGSETFAEVASAASDDTASAARGGDLGFFGRERMTPEFEQAAFDAEPGELVGPVETPFGVHLLEVTERRAAGRQPLDQVRVRIRNSLISERAQQLAVTKAGEIAAALGDEEQVTADALRTMAEADPALSFGETEPFGRDELVPAIGRSPELSAAVFELEPGAVTAPVRVPRGWMVATLEETLEPRDPALDEVEAEVRQAVEAEKRQQAAMDRLAAARADVAEGGKTFDQVAAELGLEVQESGEFGSGGAISGLGMAPRVAEAALAMDEGEVAGPFGISRGGVLFEVVSRTRFDPAAFAEAREDTRDRLESDELRRLLSSLVQQRRTELGVQYDRGLVETLDLAGTEPS
jgi:peptidyl-prolyl cis-trans isomerase D